MGHTTFDLPACSSCGNVLSTLPSAINPAGETIGSFYRDDFGAVHCFVRESDGVITGDYLGYGAHGFVRDRDRKITTFDLLALPAPCPEASTRAITGWFTYAHSKEHGFLRSPD
jgi:hypothetical protein